MKISIWKVSGRYRNKNSKYNVRLFWPHMAGGGLQAQWAGMESYIFPGEKCVQEC